MTATEGFKRHGDHSYIAHFAESEKEVLLNLCEQIIELLAERTDHGHDDPLAAMVGISVVDLRSPKYPMIALSGVRISWLTIAKN